MIFLDAGLDPSMSDPALVLAEQPWTLRADPVR
jgi:hypothetical protein